MTPAPMAVRFRGTRAAVPTGRDVMTPPPRARCVERVLPALPSERMDGSIRPPTRTRGTRSGSG